MDQYATMNEVVTRRRTMPKGPENSVWKALDHWIWTVAIALLTIYALFGDDIRLAATSQPYDPVFFSISCVCMGAFALDLVLSCVAKENYWFGFYFFLDLLSTVSLISDIGWVWNDILGTSGGSGGNLAQSTNLARAARASRAGTRAGRIIRIVRVVRLIRLVKLYKIAQERGSISQPQERWALERSVVAFRGTDYAVAPPVLMQLEPAQKANFDTENSVSFSYEKGVVEAEPGNLDSEGVSEFNALGNNSRKTSMNDGRRVSLVRALFLRQKTTPAADSEEGLVIPQESKVGRQLSDITTKRIIILVLGMLFCLPLFDSSMYVDDNKAYGYGLMVLDGALEDQGLFEEAWNDYIEVQKTQFTPLVYVEIISVCKWENVNPDDLRPEEKQFYTISPTSGSRYYSWAVEDLRPKTKVQAGLNIIRTVFICVILSVTALIFSKDANDLVIGPIENMTEMVKKMAKNPVEAAQEEEIDELAMEQADEKTSKRTKEMMETDILEKIIVKIGALLVLGFGEAGSSVIASNITRGGGDIDPLVEGKKLYCIFGFCNIRNFAEVTEVLQEGVMNFVNEIAQIVHSLVYNYSGAANKNIGDAFLLVWKVPQSCDTHLRYPQQHPCPYELNQLADMSLVAFLKVLAALNSDQKLLKYRLSPELNARLPNFSVKMGFGLHVGWAIEGAIGSEFKIDASYLSPNVNLASRLEAATKQFGVPVLFSGQVHDLLSIQVRSLTRQIDCVLMKGSKVPIRLYTLDVSLASIPAVTTLDQVVERKKLRMEQKRERHRLYQAVINREEEIWQMFESDVQLIAMRKTIKPRFLEAFKLAFKAYIDGNWREARRDLLYCLEVNGDEDGPSRTLLDYMEEQGDVSPSWWVGCRELTEK